MLMHSVEYYPRNEEIFASIVEAPIISLPVTANLSWWSSLSFRYFYQTYFPCNQKYVDGSFCGTLEFLVWLLQSSAHKILAAFFPSY